MENNIITITPNYNVYIKSTEDKGYGVFANRDIYKGEIIETCYCVDASEIQPTGALMDYVFNYPKGKTIQEGAKLVLPLGFGCIYNHADTNNTTWSDHPTLDLHFEFKAIKDIKEGEEICTNYGHNYWPDHIKRSEHLERIQNKPKKIQDGNI